MARRVPLPNGCYFYLDIATFKEIPNSDAVVSALQGAARTTQASASARAHETYTISTRRGIFRTYVDVHGEEPPAATEGHDYYASGYFRGKRTRALWSSKPVLRDKGSR